MMHMSKIVISLCILATAFPTTRAQLKPRPIDGPDIRECENHEQCEDQNGNAQYPSFCSQVPIKPWHPWNDTLCLGCTFCHPRTNLGEPSEESVDGVCPEKCERQSGWPIIEYCNKQSQCPPKPMLGGDELIPRFCAEGQTCEPCHSLIGERPPRWPPIPIARTATYRRHNRLLTATDVSHMVIVTKRASAQWTYSRTIPSIGNVNIANCAI